MRSTRTLMASAVALLAVVVVVPSAMAEPLVAAKRTNQIVHFDSANPTVITGTQTVSGLVAGEKLVGIDLRPATGVIYALTDESRMYTINTATGQATQVGTGQLTTKLRGFSFGVDFNPTVDRLRVISDANQNLRLNPNDATVSAVDFDLKYGEPDVNFGFDPVATAAAYDNNDNDGATGTTLRDIETLRDVLVIQAPPNDGVLSTVGPLGVNALPASQFDVSSTGVAYYLRTTNDGRTKLYTVNTVTGQTTFLGEVPVKKVVGMTATTAPAPPPTP